VDEHVLGSARRRFLVTRRADAVGMMTLHRIKEIPGPDWANMTTAQVMLPLDELKRISPATELWAALQLMDRDGVNQFPVMTDITVVGMVSREDVVTYLHTSTGSGCLERTRLNDPECGVAPSTGDGLEAG
jgi:CBS domain-containing protein